jgi:hypothetical protein
MVGSRSLSLRRPGQQEQDTVVRLGWFGIATPRLFQKLVFRLRFVSSREQQHGGQAANATTRRFTYSDLRLVAKTTFSDLRLVAKNF